MKKNETSEPRKVLVSLTDALFGESGAISISEKEFQGTTILVCKLKKQEFYGRIVGSQGRVIQAFQVVLGLCGRKYGKPYALQVLEMQKPTKAERLPFVPNLNWNRKWLESLAADVAAAMFQSITVFAWDTDDGQTTLEIGTFDKLPLPESKVAEALSTIFHAIGKANGREVNVSFNVSK